MLVKTTLDSEYTVGNTVRQLPEHICEDVKTSTDETEPVTLICIEWICKVQRAITLNKCWKSSLGLRLRLCL